ncbi:MAG: response regulator [Candidatus Omnitrophica bacterium]|nr:response regulator [Candidatus Omnitrophota bacterium]
MRKKILLIDDEKGFTNMLRLNLSATGDYDVVVENDSLHALDAALQVKPDLILLDVIMPHKEGPDVFTEIKENDQLRETPVIFLTATVTEDEVNTYGGRIGGNTFIAKPTRMEDLVESIERNLIASY